MPRLEIGKGYKDQDRATNFWTMDAFARSSHTCVRVAGKALSQPLHKTNDVKADGRKPAWGMDRNQGLQGLRSCQSK